MLLWPNPTLEIHKIWLKREALKNILENFSQMFSIHVGWHHAPTQPGNSQKGQHVALLLSGILTPSVGHVKIYQLIIWPLTALEGKPWHVLIFLTSVNLCSHKYIYRLFYYFFPPLYSFQFASNFLRTSSQEWNLET